MMIFMIVFVEWNDAIGEFMGFTILGGGQFMIMAVTNVCLLEVAL